MPRQSSSIPTEVELEILHVLWQQGGPSTVRQIYKKISQQKNTAFSTTLRMVQVMIEKGLLLKDENAKPQIFWPAKPREQTQLQLVDHLIQKGFGGSALTLVLSAAAAQRITTQELDQVRELIDKTKAGQQTHVAQGQSKRGHQAKRGKK